MNELEVTTINSITGEIISSRRTECTDIKDGLRRIREMELGDFDTIYLDKKDYEVLE